MNDLLGIIAPLRKFLSQEEERIHVKGLEDDLLTLPANRTYIIPDFQREIRWNEDNVSMLIDDLKSSPCFLGNIILTQHKDSKYSVIDGQQRLTILTMIIKCIYLLHGNRIEVVLPCNLEIESFAGFSVLLGNDFDVISVSSENIKESDKLHQAEKYQKLWEFIKSHKEIVDIKEASRLLDNLTKSQVNIILNQSDDIKDGIRYFIDVNLKGKQLDAEDIFKSYLFKNDTRKEIRELWYQFKTNVVNAEKNKIDYPLLKYIEHFLYCDLYKDPKYKGMEFGDDFRLKKEFKTKEEIPEIHRKGSHIIEVISDNQYMRNMFIRLNNIILIMNRIAKTSSSDPEFEIYFPCINGKKHIDRVEYNIFHNIIKKMLRESNLLPKALVMKYILEVLLDDSAKDIEEYQKIYGVYLLAVLFIVFENSKSKDILLGVLKAESSLWYSEAVSQIKSYFSTDKITDTRLLAQYKIVSSKDAEDYRFRCKSLATIYNYFKVQKDKVIVQKKQELNSYINDGSRYSIEHFIISESQQRQMMIKNKEAMFTYTLDEKIYKKYVNSIFNFIFVSQNLNSDLGNYWLPSKLNVIKSNVIECEYSQLVIKHSLKIAQKMQSLSLEEDNFKDSLDLFFARDYKDQYLELSKTVLDAVIERIKN